MPTDHVLLIKLNISKMRKINLIKVEREGMNCKI